MSMSITSGLSSRKKSSAAWPSLTAPTSWICGSDSSKWTKRIRAVVESSTTSTLILSLVIRYSLLRQSSHGFEQVTLNEAAFYEIGVSTHVNATLSVLSCFPCRHQHHG